MNITPTGTPFDDTLLFFDALVPAKFRHLLADRDYADRYRIVHGICQSSTGIIYCTAWVEHGPLAWSCAFIEGERAFYAVSRSDHYALVGARQIIRYPLDVAVTMSVLFGCGPWDPMMINLCRETMEVVGNARGPRPLVIVPVQAQEACHEAI